MPTSVIMERVGWSDRTVFFRAGGGAAAVVRATGSGVADGVCAGPAWPPSVDGAGRVRSGRGGRRPPPRHAGSTAVQLEAGVATSAPTDADQRATDQLGYHHSDRHRTSAGHCTRAARARAGGSAEVNLAHWEAGRRPRQARYLLRHGGARGGRDSITDLEEPGARRHNGLDVVHIQCHIGFDTISLARRGARMTGVDFSPGSLAKAARPGGALRRRDRVGAVRRHRPAGRPRGRFDLAYASYGAICWIGDMAAWMRPPSGRCGPAAASCSTTSTRSSGWSRPCDPLSLDFPYANEGGRAVDGIGHLRRSRHRDARQRPSITRTRSARSSTPRWPRASGSTGSTSTSTSPSIRAATS